MYVHTRLRRCPVSLRVPVVASIWLLPFALLWWSLEATIAAVWLIFVLTGLLVALLVAGGRSLSRHIPRTPQRKIHV